MLNNLTMNSMSEKPMYGTTYPEELKVLCEEREQHNRGNVFYLRTGERIKEDEASYSYINMLVRNGKFVHKNGTQN